MEESDIVEIPPPVNWASKPKSLKRKEHAVTDLSYSSAGTHYNASGNDVKATGASYKGSKYSKGTFYGDLIYVNDDAPTYANGNNINSFTGSAPTQSASQAQADPKSFPSSKSYWHPLPLLSKTEHVKANNEGAPQAYGHHANSNSGNKPVLPHVHSVQNHTAANMFPKAPLPSNNIYQNLQNHTPTAANMFPKAPLPSNNIYQNLQNHTPTAANMFPTAPLPSNNSFQNLQNHIYTAAKKIPKASIPTHNGSFGNLGPNMNTGMSSNVGVNHMLPGFNSLPLNPSMPTHNGSFGNLGPNMNTGMNSNVGVNPMLPGFNSVPLNPSMPTHNGSFGNLGPNMNTGMSSNVGVNHMLPGFSSLPLNPSMPTHNGSFGNLGPHMNTGMSSNVGVNHMIPGFSSSPLNPSTPASYYSGGFTTAFRPSFPNLLGLQKNLTSIGKVSGSPGPSSFKIVDENPDVILKKLDQFKKFDTVEDFSDHIYSMSNAFAMNQPSKSWAKKIQGEWRILENDLPDTIFVRVCESRMDLLRAAIIGAEGTPYHDGLFFFDMFFPRDYPNVPPQVTYHSGGLHINPNLYECGYVCLSLLNTWDGDKREMWIPGESTVLQVLVSIQALILNEKPYFNEPGYEFESGLFHGENESLNYNEETYINSLRTMVYSIRKPPKHFEDLVVGHFFKRAHDILAACRAYKNGAQVGSVVVKGGVESVSNKGQRVSSQRFQNELAGYLKTLVEAFGQVAVKDCDKFLH